MATRASKKKKTKKRVKEHSPEFYAQLNRIDGKLPKSYSTGTGRGNPSRFKIYSPSR